MQLVDFNKQSRFRGILMTSLMLQRDYMASN